MLDPVELPRPSRRRLIVFWLAAATFLVLVVGQRLAEEPTYFLVPITVWGGWGLSADHPDHTVHTLLVSLLYWVNIVGVGVQLRRPERQIGGAYVYGLGAFVLLAALLAIGAVPADMVPILIGVMVFSGIAFVAHPSPLGAKFRPVERPSLLLAGMVALAAIPLVVFSVDSFGIHLASGPGDEHFELGHWAFMGVYPIVAILLGGVAAAKVSGWRLPGWVAAVFVGAHGLASLIVPSASAVGTLWAGLAVGWAVAFVIAIESEARAGRAHATEPQVTAQPAI